MPTRFFCISLAYNAYCSLSHLSQLTRFVNVSGTWWTLFFFRCCPKMKCPHSFRGESFVVSLISSFKDYLTIVLKATEVFYSGFGPGLRCGRWWWWRRCLWQRWHRTTGSCQPPLLDFMSPVLIAGFVHIFYTGSFFGYKSTSIYKVILIKYSTICLNIFFGFVYFFYCLGS